MVTSETPHIAAHTSKHPTVGVLLVHGLNGTKEDMAEMEAYLQARRMLTQNILLPGHGVPIREMASASWKDWTQAVRSELNHLKQRCDAVFLIGHSLGGALTLHVAAHEEVAGIVAMCAPIRMYPGIKELVGVVKRITPFLPRLHDDIRDPEVRRSRRNLYRWAPLSPVHSFLEFLPQLRAELPLITAPILIMTAIDDHVVPPRDSREIYRFIGSQEKYLVTFHHSYHMLMKDHDREEVFAQTAAFIQHHAGPKPHVSPVPRPHTSPASPQMKDRDQP
jgi:carboxylesterase